MLKRPSDSLISDEALSVIGSEKSNEDINVKRTKPKVADLLRSFFKELSDSLNTDHTPSGTSPVLFPPLEHLSSDDLFRYPWYELILRKNNLIGKYLH
ncbi:unnamed protein product [Nezara viridula]|uniref:Uncharacterized protein n=1 Tax=Nezara viridula TaxID=85310 RepID=A0A9P0EDB9_NEZVI|nr:unnamed protein product [Nezara viridula]